MSNLILFTSGSTKEAKEVEHSWDFINTRIDISIKELELTKDDVVINVLPFNVIGYHTIMAGPATKVGATLIHMNFDPYAYIRMFNKYQPTIIGLIPKHIELLQQTKGFDTLDMTCVRYMIMGSQNVPQSMIDMLLAKGIKTIGNWYGSTEYPPPVMIAHNGSRFESHNFGYQVTFDSDGLCYVNGEPTGDVFDTESYTFLKRKTDVSNFNTWKNKPQG